MRYYYFCSGTNNMEGGERCAFCSWKYGHYFELFQKNTHTQMLDQVPAEDIDGKCRGPVGVRFRSVQR